MDLAGSFLGNICATRTSIFPGVSGQSSFLAPAPMQGGTCISIMLGTAPGGLDRQTLIDHKPTATPIWFLGLDYPLNRILMLSVMCSVALGNGGRR